jgi:molybdopterin/thiamine biosynthesis adenylyltransferase
MAAVNAFLRDHATNGILPWCWQVSAADRFHLSLAAVEERALEMGILPSRYQRNSTTLSTANQLTLFRSHATVIGCGGLGGYQIEELARLGVGWLTVVDPDIFEEHNLNRQILSTVATLGTAKVTAAVRRVAEINPAVTITGLQERFCAKNGIRLLDGSNIVVDALDSIPDRIELAALCNRLALPLVHGAIAGWYGHVASQLPGEETIARIYQTWHEEKGVEQQLGNPSFTPAVVASMQVAEACKILLKKGSPLTGRKLYIDLLEMEINEIKL